MQPSQQKEREELLYKNNTNYMTSGGGPYTLHAQDIIYLERMNKQSEDEKITIDVVFHSLILLYNKQSLLTIDLYMQFQNTCLNISWIFSLFLSKADPKM